MIKMIPCFSRVFFPYRIGARKRDRYCNNHNAIECFDIIIIGLLRVKIIRC